MKYQAHRAGKTDGRQFPATEEDIAPGTVLRLINRSDGSAAPFSDMVVLGVRMAGPKDHEYQEVTMARPYLYATGTGNALTGTETVKVDLKRILSEDSQFRVLVTARGNVEQSLT